VFFATILYAIGFVGNFWPWLGLSGPFFRGMDLADPGRGLLESLGVDALLLGVFALQHSGMARPAFKRWWTRIVPPAAERSTYVLLASLCLDLLFWLWRPLGTAELWRVDDAPVANGIVALSIVGWLVVFVSTFMLDHFELFGLRQAWYAFRGQALREAEFATPGLYRAVRHPIYLGFVIAFWSTPTMTLGHFVFASATTGYILVAIQLEERDLVQRYGELYRSYRRRVGMLFPRPLSRSSRR
jgi:protein-S-isoprenylcysteine O-methyltransferase Ste14